MLHTSFSHSTTVFNILNLTQHSCSSEQAKVGVFEPRRKEEIKALLTFNSIPTQKEIEVRASKIAEIANDEFGKMKGDIKAMIGGAPYLMALLEEALRSFNITPVYAFSKRESQDIPQKDGSIKKVMVFRHLGFVEV